MKVSKAKSIVEVVWGLRDENEKLRARVATLEGALRESCEDNRSLALAEPGRTATCPLLDVSHDEDGERDG